MRVWPAVLEGYRFVAGNPLTVLRLALLPVLCLTAVHFALSGFAPPPVDDMPGLREIAADIGESIVAILLIAVTLVAWQRRILLGPGKAGLRFWKRELRMSVAVFGLGLVLAIVNAIAIVLAIPAALFGADGLIGLYDGAAWIAAAYLTARLYFALPPISIDRGTTLGEVWRASGVQAHRLMLIVALTSIPFEVLSMVADKFAENALHGGVPAILVGATLLKNLVFVLYIVVEAAALTFCYAALGGVPHIIEARNAEAGKFRAEPAAAPA